MDMSTFDLSEDAAEFHCVNGDDNWVNFLVRITRLYWRSDCIGWAINGDVGRKKVV